MCGDSINMLMMAYGVQAGGNIMAGQDARRQAGAEAAQLDQQALYERDTGKVTAEKIRKHGAAQRGAAVAAQAASGVRVGEGSALDAERQIMANTEEDAMLTLLSGDRQAEQLRYQGSLTRRAGRNAQRNSWLAASTNVLAAGYEYNRWKGRNTPIDRGYADDLPTRGGR